jgi:hypothetical protein
VSLYIRFAIFLLQLLAPEVVEVTESWENCRVESFRICNLFRLLSGRSIKKTETGGAYIKKEKMSYSNRKLFRIFEGVGTNFANKRRPLGRYSSLADYKPRSLVFF